MSVSSILILLVLMVLYALAWHDKPAQPAVIGHRDNRKQPPEGNSTRGKLHEYKSASR